MIIHKCDICGKEMGAWLKVTTYVEASRNDTNVSDLAPYSGSFDICGKCFKNFIHSQDVPYMKLNSREGLL